ncbi:MAG: AraC family transcriptional regulator [Spirochaetes bacterium]|nr:AraC family transcriptional regulator [Spirochaetota bacterium]MBU0956303.1 AraC family transcriptional regulator [Spirochaetota bacterium]
MIYTRRYQLDSGWKKRLKTLGMNPAAVLREAGLAVDLLDKKNVSVTSLEYYRLWKAMTRLVDQEEPFPLVVAKSVNFDHFSPPLMAAICSPDFLTCARRIQHLKPLIGPMVLTVEQNSFHVTVSYKSLEGEAPLDPLVVLAEHVFWTELIRKATGTQVIPVEIISREPLVDVAYERYFGLKPRPGSRDAIIFTLRDAQLPFVTENESLWGFFEPQLQKHLDELEQDSTFAGRVRNILVELLPLGESSIDVVAEKLRVSRRTLQRRLNDENTNYQKCLNHTRELLARHYLTQSDVSSAEISFLLGFEDPGSFCRVFHLWVGQTPEDFRRRQQGLAS